MPQREIKIRSFVFDEEYDDPQGTTRTRNRIGTRGEVVELNQFWANYGDAMGAFVTEADRKAEETDEDVLDTAETVEEMGEDELMNWVSDSTIPQIMSVANADPTLCSRILEAENKATGNDPRTGLVEGLARIAGNSEAAGTGTTPEEETEPANSTAGEEGAPVPEAEETVEQLSERLGVDLSKVEVEEGETITPDDVKEYYDEELANATDGAVELAEEEDIFLADVTGTGEGGRITKDDVTKYIAANNEATAAGA